MQNEITIAEGFKGEKAIITPYSIREYQEINLITRQLYLTHIGYYPVARYHFRERRDGANENILLFCENGKGWIEHRNVRQVLSQNQAYILPANETHIYGADKRTPWSIYWLHFKGQHVGMFNAIIGKVLSMKNSDNPREIDQIMLFEDMYQNLEMGYSPENLEYVSYCLLYFLASFKYPDQFKKIKDVKIDNVVQQCIHYMKDNLENEITLSSIAKYAGYSNSHLNTLFTKRTSYSPMVYYNQLRIQRACSYLQFSELKINEIAFRLGYYDPFHFSKAFNKEMGITPKTYKQKYHDSYSNS
ncbi:MAG: AraC family transcriptional regulator [Bacteroidales bacterium]|nr:AraC family transcriptional regulator [Bacteroidales bacterium]